MSGIAGLFCADGEPVAVETLEGMIAATPHLGRDGSFHWRKGPLGLIRFALNTTPEAANETQPYVDSRTGEAIVFDGRLDNRDELREQLGLHGPGPKAPDCEIALALFQRFGSDMLARFVGDYALAVWQQDARRLLLARSPVGMRPLLWTNQGTRFAFATEPATLIRGLKLPRRLNEGAIAEHLASRFVTEMDTFWEGVYRVPPGSALSVENGLVRTWRWHVGPFEDWSGRSQADHVERFTVLFDQALLAATRSSGPVAAQLSGGLDSSTVVCRLSQMCLDGRIAQMATPISARFPGEACDEGEWIAAVERQCNFSSRMVEGAPFDVATAALWCARTLHLPMRPNTSATVQAVCRQAGSIGAKVLLTGEGGDDWLSGSRSHWPDLLRTGRWIALFKEVGLVGQGWSNPLMASKGLLASSLGPLVSQRRRHRLVQPHLDFSHQAPWLSADWVNRVELRNRWAAAPAPPTLPFLYQQERYHAYAFARRHINFDTVLSFVASEGIELRHPFHDLRLTRFLMGASGGVLRRGDLKKDLLREATRGVLPQEVRLRTSKANMSAPIIDAVTKRFEERAVREMLPVRLGWLDATVLETIQSAHVAWRRSGSAAIPAAPYGAVWNAMAMDIWLEHAFELQAV